MQIQSQKRKKAPGFTVNKKAALTNPEKTAAYKIAEVIVSSKPGGAHPQK